MSKRPRKALANAPTATRAAISRALARSECPAPVVKIVLGRAGKIGVSRTRAGDRTALVLTSSDVLHRKGFGQFDPSRLRMTMATGEPMVWGWRTPATISAQSVQILIRPPHP